MANLIDIENYNNGVLNENKEIKFIIHISDIHIKNNCDREKEYNYVFNSLYEYIKKIKEQDKTIIIITGDLLDSNIEKNCNINTKLFIENICKYIECVIILGNHDITNGQKYNEISKLESVLYNLKTKNPYYLLTKDGNYEFKNIIIGLTTMCNNKVTQIESDKIKIGLYHGTIKEISSNKHQYTNSGNFSINEFEKYDYVLLGDIHKRQKIKNGFYAGSLLQLDSSEDINKGGYIIDLNKKKVEEFNLTNDTGFYKVIIDKKGTVKSNIDIKKIPKNAKLIIENNSLNDDTQNKYIKDLEENGVNVLEKKIVYKINNNLEKEIELLGNKYDLNNLRKKETILEIIKLYLTTEGKISDDNKIKRILNKVENIIETKQQFLRTIKLKKLKINNMAVFGNDIIIDFELLKNNKITNLYGTNDAGKTSVIECLLLAFTGKSSKKGNNNEFIHNKEKIGYKINRLSRE
jgi:DNA repair exonuclease SbcCD nuclease subunit